MGGGTVTCPYCGAPDATVFPVTYDAMVDGLGCEETEERCGACSRGSQREEIPDERDADDWANHAE